MTEVIDLARAHRMGKSTPGKTRPIVPKFERYQQREKVRMAGPRLAGKRFGVSEISEQKPQGKTAAGMEITQETGRPSLYDRK